MDNTHWEKASDILYKYRIRPSRFPFYALDASTVLFWSQKERKSSHTSLDKQVNKLKY